MRLVSEGSRTVVPRNVRICSFERLIMPWRLPAWPVFTFPLAVNRKRFLALDFVFSLGILRLLWRQKPHRFVSRHGMPCTPGGSGLSAALYARRPDLQGGGGHYGYSLVW